MFVSQWANIEDATDGLLDRSKGWGLSKVNVDVSWQSITWPHGNEKLIQSYTKQLWGDVQKWQKKDAKPIQKRQQSDTNVYNDYKIKDSLFV